jgi:hypothetical protein
MARRVDSSPGRDGLETMREHRDVVTAVVG